MKQSFELKTLIKSIFSNNLLHSNGNNLLTSVIIDSSHKINKNKVEKFFKDFYSLQGWLSIFAAKTILWLDFIQKQEKIEGNLFEIGVYLGKSSILFGLFVDQEKERLGLCDHFKAGERRKIPQKEILYKNLNSYFDNLEFIDIYDKESIALTLDECKNSRMFHIDGGHTFVQLTNDLQLAETAIIDKGLIIIDDFFNPRCPEVTEGVYKYLDKGTLTPIMVGFMKLVLCKKSMYKWYFEKINTLGWKNYINNEKIDFLNRKMFGYNILTGGQQAN